jgi:hypothetical protein
MGKPVTPFSQRSHWGCFPYGIRWEIDLEEEGIA